jgi:uncharacterized membrane protein
MSNNRNLFAAASYVTWVGFLIALVAADRSDRFIAHHMNQALVLNIASIVGGVLRVIPVLGALASNIISTVLLILAVIGIYRALTGSSRPLPVVGDIHLIG